MRFLLRVPPADLTAGVAAQRTDGYIYATIRNGSIVMPSYADAMSPGSVGKWCCTCAGCKGRCANDRASEKHGVAIGRGGGRRNPGFRRGRLGRRRRATRAWEAFLVNLIFWLGVAQGAIIVSASFYLTQARSGGAGAYRLAEAFVGFLPVGFILFWVLLIGRHQIFVWIDHPLPEKAGWLNTPFLFARDGSGVAAHDPAEPAVREPVAARGYHSMGVHRPAISPIRRHRFAGSRW